MKYKKLLSAVIGGFCLCFIVYQTKVWSYPDLEEAKLYVVSNVIDGDTFDIKARLSVFRVRMLGVDTPETVDPRKLAQCYGTEASAEVKELLTGRSVWLEFSPDRELTDRYGRYLAYVYRDDGLFMNKHLLEGGFAREYTFGKAYSLQKEFRKMERGSWRSKIGLWGACDY